jgi:drug/metabolite transporter (DMT)-like permease
MAAVWVATFVFSTGPVMIATATASGPVLSFWRMLVGVPLLAAVAGAHLLRTGRRPSAAGWRLAARAGVAFAVHQVTLMSALRTSSVVDVALMNALAPIVVAVLAVPLFGERPGGAFRAWSAVAMAGAMGVAWLGSTGTAGNPTGMVLAAANVVFYSLYFVTSKQARPEIDTWPFLFGAFGVGTVLVSVFAVVARADVGSITAHDLLVGLFIAAGPGLVGHGLMTWSLEYVPANVPPVVMLAIPLFSGTMAWLLVGQTVSAGKVAAGVLTLAGVLGAVWSAGGRAPVVVEALALAEET